MDRMNSDISDPALRWVEARRGGWGRAAWRVRHARARARARRAGALGQIGPVPAAFRRRRAPNHRANSCLKMPSSGLPPAARAAAARSKAAIGPDKIGLAAGAIALGLIIVLVSGADFSPSNRCGLPGPGV
jgi:hypothetical protein